MTRLLVSVRSVDEAILAAEAGVDLIDLKEPSHGSLGRVEIDEARLVCDQLPPHQPLSMALGELTEWSSADWELVPQIPQGIAFAKVGLAGCAKFADWQHDWHRALGALPPHCQSVAVVYADWKDAGAPEPMELVDAATSNGCQALLIDTWCKDRGNVFAQCDPALIDKLIRRAKLHGLLTVLAGSLGLDDLDDALSLAPGFVAVRGAVCSGPREGTLCAEKLAAWRERVGKMTNADSR